MIDAKDRRSDRSKAIDAYLLKHYPCQSLPHGALKEVGDLFGVSREWIRQRANKLGMGRVPHTPAVRVCACGQPLPKNRGKYCDDCLYPMLVCDRCGVSFRGARTIYQIIRDVRAGCSKHFYCGVACSATAMARYERTPESLAKFRASMAVTMARRRAATPAQLANQGDAR